MKAGAFCMAHSDRTSIGGGKSRFQTTRWSIIEAAKTDDQTRRQTIVGNLMATYWKPVYCYLKRRGYDNETAKDLTQGFFCEIVFGRELVHKAEREKGRFRTFLLTALERYVVSVLRHETSARRSPGAASSPLTSAIWRTWRRPRQPVRRSRRFIFAGRPTCSNRSCPKSGRSTAARTVPLIGRSSA